MPVRQNSRSAQSTPLTFVVSQGHPTRFRRCRSGFFFKCAPFDFASPAVPSRTHRTGTELAYPSHGEAGHAP